MFVMERELKNFIKILLVAPACDGLPRLQQTAGGHRKTNDCAC